MRKQASVFIAFIVLTTSIITSVNIPAFSAIRNFPHQFSVPQSITVAPSTTPGAISVSWNRKPNSQGYVVRVYSTPGPNLLLPTSYYPNPSSSRVTALITKVPNTRYRVSVQTIGDGSRYLDSRESRKINVVTYSIPTINSASVTGTPEVNQPLTAQANSVTGNPTPNLSYQWKISNTSGGTYTNIADANVASYTPLVGDVGKYVKVVVTATNSVTSASATSEASSVIAAIAPATFTSSPTPTICKPMVASPCSATAGSWDPSPSLSYQWQISANNSDWTDIGTDSASYTPVAGDEGKYLRVRVSATSAGYTTTERTSLASGAVFPAPAQAVNLTSLITAPAKGNAQDITTVDAETFTGAIAWYNSDEFTPAPSNFLASTVYVAAVDLTAKPGFTLADLTGTFTHTDSNSISYSYKGIVTITFAATAALTSQSISFSSLSAMSIGDSDQTPTVSASSGLSVTLTSADTSICTVVSSKIRAVATGECTITASQSGNGIYSAAVDAVQTFQISGLAYSLNQVGPGGGTIFYVSAEGFTCGSTRAQTCHYLEAAPTNWVWGGSETGSGDGTNDAGMVAWSGNTTSSVGLISGITAAATGIGWGAWNTFAILMDNLTIGTASYRAPNYRGGGLSDWFLPSKDELNELWKTRSSAESLSLGYWSSSDSTATEAWNQAMASVNGLPRAVAKNLTRKVRPIRSF